MLTAQYCSCVMPMQSAARIPLEYREMHSVALITPLAFNLSGGGMGVRVSEPLCDDEIVQLRFSLPGSPRCIQARGEVAWADREGNMGFKFIGMSQECATALMEWLQRKFLV